MIPRYYITGTYGIILAITVCWLVELSLSCVGGADGMIPGDNLKEVFPVP